MPQAVSSQPMSTEPPSRPFGRKSFARLAGRNTLWIALVALVVALLILSPPFRNPATFQNILMQNGIIGIVALGMLVMMISGGFDLSVGAAGGAVGVLVAYLSGIWGLPVAIPVGIVLGLIIGFINGIIIARMKIDSFITTFALASIITGVLFVFTSGSSIKGNAGPLTNFVFEVVLGIPVLFIVFIAFAVITYVILSKTKWGHWVYGVGANSQASFLSGVPVLQVKIAAFMFGGLAVGIGGTLLFGQSAIGQPTAGAAWPLDAIAICVIGGASLSGGVGRVSNVVAAVLLLGLEVGS